MTDHQLNIEARHLVARRRTLRIIAVFEAVKGIAALVLMVGMLDLMHRDVRHLAMELIGHFGLHPDAHYPAILLQYAARLSDINPVSLLLLGVVYITVRLLEAYGLWNDKAWAEWLAALSGVLYIPFEFHHLLYRPSLINGAVLAGNAFVVGFMTYQLWCRRLDEKTR